MSESSASTQEDPARADGSPELTLAERARVIERLHQKRWSTTRIAREPGLSVSTSYLESRRLRLGCLKSLDPPTPTTRYERDETATATGFLRRAIRWIEAQGVATERMMADNGSCYRSRLFAAALNEAGTRHLSAAPSDSRWKISPTETAGIESVCSRTSVRLLTGMPTARYAGSRYREPRGLRDRSAASPVPVA